MARKCISDRRAMALVFKLEDVKRTVNSILENGAYSDKNYQVQMNKKANNYNPDEQILVTAGFLLKKHLGLKLQRELLNMISSDEEFLQYVKSYDESLYEQIKGMINNDKKEQ
jgi:hypothetical protein